MAKVAICPRCEESIEDTYENSWCQHCGDPLPAEIKKRLPKLVALLASNSPNEETIDSADSGPRSPVLTKYRDAYRVGATLVTLGTSIKILGAILAAIIFLGALSSGSGSFGGGGVVVGGVFVAVIVGVLFWVCGVVVAAQGQILQATLDNAVATSPFLNNQERARAMGLSASVIREVRAQEFGAA